MLATVVEDVHERVTNFLRRHQVPRVVAFVPDSPAAMERPVDRLRDADREALDPAPERHRVVTFDEQVDVIALNAELQQPESSARSTRECPAHRPEDAFAAE
jgi:hypothetical protein